MVNNGFAVCHPKMSAFFYLRWLDFDKQDFVEIRHARHARLLVARFCLWLRLKGEAIT